MSELRQRLESEVMPATWALLGEHAKRDALFLAVPPLQLVDAAVAVAEDDKAAVAGWVEKGALRRPTKAELSRWDAQPVAFVALIVQPFVIATEIKDR